MFTLILFASVPFVGNITSGVLTCNAPCTVWEGPTVVFHSDQPVRVPWVLPGTFIITRN